jgi:hypothetical protein
MPRKVIATSFAALEAKYAGAGAGAVRAALDTLVAADAQRGIDTAVVDLGDADGPPAGSAVTDPADERQVKAAVDQVWATLAPEYLVLLGGPDVVPHQTLVNPARDDDGPDLPSDLPYACDAGYAADMTSFLAPTRVVTRLPDVTEAADPAVLLEILEHVTTATSRPAAEYGSCLGISAAVWEGSTSLTLATLFGPAADVRLSPTEGPRWDPPLLGRRSHFVNCHGAPLTPFYIGEGPGGTPVAHDAGYVDGALAAGTVLSAECCYGAELYPEQDGRLGMAYAYLRSGGYGVFGSTNIAYGPAVGNAAADVICREFLRAVLAGASVGRAALEARQAYIASLTGPLDPIDLKTLGQFVALGDAAVHPVVAPPVPPLAIGTAAADPGGRRQLLRAKGVAVSRTLSYADPKRRHDTPPDDVAALSSLMGITDAAHTDFAVYPIVEPMAPKTLRGGGAPGASVVVAIERRARQDLPIRQHIARVAVKRGDSVTSLRTLYSR